MTFADMAHLCGLAYVCAGETEKQHLRTCISARLQAAHGLVYRPFGGQGSTEGFVAYHPEKRFAYVVFRGTERELADIKHGLCAWPVQNAGGPGKVHAGVQTALQTVWPEVLVILQEAGVVNVHFLGHSLGGMLAVLAACWCYSDLKDVVVGGVTTFGSPPCGCRVFAGAMGFAFKGKIQHIINGTDIVPRLLTTRIVMGYRHPGVIFYITPEGALIERPSLCRRIKDVFLVGLKSCLGFLRCKGWTAPSVSSHAVRRYWEKLQKIEAEG